ncbi:hypothetical protein BDZ90DRAFT_229008 [Jaminaea rosea]|uniref:Uncharacterized protein n=1 Tax=Jaminaea rosea TaxID=1569628 RepID=A0A316UY91_9BASI|nr:hypothetical protein BDZ90DRAFT_229008 [Jaminaea rosea]PWN29964.1 hypothetical protein BDZ90DRAFT_229008 [Jaminaea rosea]
MASATASSSRRPGGGPTGLLDMASAGPSGLPAITGPTDQLHQIQKKLQALVASTGQLQMELAMTPILDWPTILSRFGTLVSQTYSLSSSLTSASSTFLPAQLDNVQRTLEEEARTSNYFMSEEAALRATTSEGVPPVSFADGRNTLPRLSAVPTTTLDGDKTARLGEALRTKLEPEVQVAHDEAIAALRSIDTEQTSLGKDANISHADLNAILKAVRAHDEIAARALRAWYHVRWRPDEDDQTYDFRMRLPEGDTGELDDDDEADGDMVDVGDVGEADEAGGTAEQGGREERPSEAGGTGEGGEDVEQDEDDDMEEIT